MSILQFGLAVSPKPDCQKNHHNRRTLTSRDANRQQSPPVGELFPIDFLLLPFQPIFFFGSSDSFLDYARLRRRLSSSSNHCNKGIANGWTYKVVASKSFILHHSEPMIGVSACRHAALLVTSEI